MKSELTVAERKKIRMINYYAFILGAFLSLIFAFVLGLYGQWAATHGFAWLTIWLFKLMHDTAHPELKGSGFETIISYWNSLQGDKALPSIDD